MKNVLTLVLICISSLWASLAACTASYTTSSTQTAIFDGTINSAPLPCEQGEDCVDCMTYVLVAADKTYYLTMTPDMESAMGAEMYEIGTYTPQATIEGVPFTQGSYQYLKVINYTLKEPGSMLESAIDNISTVSASAAKLLRDGQLLILRDGKTYTVTGQEVK